MQQGPTPDFNRLSRRDQFTLVMAAGMKEMTGIMREDVEAHPWLYPFYLLPAICMTAPGGFTVGIPALLYVTDVCATHIITAAVGALGPTGAMIAGVPVAALGIGAVVRYGAPWVRQVKERMASVFNKQALVDNHREFILEENARLKLDKSAVTKHATRKSVHDLKEATINTWYSLTLFSRHMP